MASRTATFRQQVPNIRRSLLSKIKLLEDFANQSEPSVESELAKYLKRAHTNQDTVTNCLSKCRELVHNWSTAINAIDDGDTQKTEEAVFAKAVSDSVDGFDALAEKLQDMLSELKAGILLLERTMTVPATVNSLQRNSDPGIDRDLMKVDKIALPKFDGDLFKFQGFWTTFCAAIHDRHGMTKTVKMAHLMALLEGKAKEAVDGFDVTEENYDLAVDILHQRFNRRGQRMVTMLYGRLHRVPCSGKGCEEKRRTFDECEKIFRQLEQSGENIDANQSLILQLLGKFPAGMVRELERTYGLTPELPLSDLRAAIEQLLTDLEMSYGFHEDVESFRDAASRSTKAGGERKPTAHTGKGSLNANFDASRKKTEGLENSEFRASTMAAVAAGSNNAEVRSVNKCFFCDGDHYNSDCRKYPTASSRAKRLEELGRCVRCAKRHGPRKNCRNFVRCYYCRSTNDHYSPLCPKHFPETTVMTSVAESEKSESEPEDNDSVSSDDQASVDRKCGFADGLAVLASGGQKALFLTAKVAAVNLKTGTKCNLRVVLDTLSTCSYIVSQKAQELGLESLGSKTTYVKTFSAKKAAEVPTERVKFGLVRRDTKGVLEVDALSVKLISDCEVLPASIPVEDRRVLADLTDRMALADDLDDKNRTIDVLIGADHVWDIILGVRQKLPGNSSIGIVPTVFGSMLCGRVDAKDSQSSPTLMCIASSLSSTPHPVSLHAEYHTSKNHCDIDVDEYWKLETIGITEPPVDDDDEIAMREFRENVVYEDGRYAVKWPFLENKKKNLPSNFNTAFRRFKMMDARLKKDPSLMQKYKEVITDQVAKGVIEKVPEQEIVTKNAIHYLPHHPVIKASSATTKVRIVYDASSKPRKEDVSLNECLRRGPILLPDLCQLLIRFRTSHTVVVSDVEKAFLQIMLQSSDRDVTRFLWYADPDNPDVSKLAFYRFCRVAFGLKSSPFLLGATIQHHLERADTDFARRLLKDVYVDNIISGVDTDRVIEYYAEVKALFREAGMNLQEFCSNSRDLMEVVPETDRVRNTDVKVLGLQWDSLSDDTIRVPKSSKFDEFAKIGSKRGVLKTGASIFDPLGVFQPVTFPAKLFLQRLWLRELSWDEPLPTDMQQEWTLLCSEIRPMFKIRMPRFIGKPTSESSLVVFSDASAKGYGAAVFLRSWNAELGNWTSRLICAKSRLAPPKKAKSAKAKSVQPEGEVSIPRLELLGAVVATRLASFVREAVGMRDLYAVFFIDSESVLHWLRSNKELSKFVKRRVDEIHKMESADFCYVRTADNPADLLTRGKQATELAAENLWWYGPAWLQNDKTTWPQPRVPDISSAALKEIGIGPQIDVCHVTVGADAPLTLLRIDPQKTSSLNKLLRITCLVLKFIKKLVWERARGTRAKCSPTIWYLIDGITADATICENDLKLVLEAWIRQIQAHCFNEAIAAVRSGSKNSLVTQLGLKLDVHDLLRSHGRYVHARVPDNAKFPMLLPKNNPFSELVVRDVHFRLKHSGPTHTLCELRQSYWIPHGRAYVKSVLGRCIVCRKCKNGPPFALPDMPPYPVERVSQAVPFQTTGVDYFGPLNVKVHGEVRKMWVSLFTCLRTRAIHLEPVLDCSSEEFLNCFIRFVSRRGMPSEIISDNAAHFRLTKILGDLAWRKRPGDPNLTSYLAKSGIKWSFIIELAPWQGGHYERLVGVVKSVLKTAIGRRLLSWTDLVTLLVETEAIVNSRPITYVGDDLDAQMRVLRPMDFLVQGPVAVDSNEQETGSKNLSDGARLLLKIWKRRQNHLEKLWKEWYNQYVLSLRERSKTVHHGVRGNLIRSPREGEVVLVRNDDLPRGSWKLGKVKSLIFSNDGKVRAAEVLLPNRMTIRRAVNFLFPLEVDQAPGNMDTEWVARNTNPADDEDELFVGFSNKDIRATRDALARYEWLSDDEGDLSSDDE